MMANAADLVVRPKYSSALPSMLLASSMSARLFSGGREWQTDYRECTNRETCRAALWLRHHEVNKRAEADHAGASTVAEPAPAERLLAGRASQPRRPERSRWGRGEAFAR
jgi:hypothetical protein